MKNNWILDKNVWSIITRGPKGHISCTWVPLMCHLFDVSARTAIFVYWSARKTQSWKRTLGSCFLSSFIEFHSVVLEEKLKMSQPIRGRGDHLAFFDRPEKHKIGRGCWDLATCQVSLNSVQQFLKRSQKMFQPIRGRGVHLVFLISPKNTKLVKDVEILLPIKFRWIPFSVFRGKVKNTLCWQHVINSI